MVTETDLRLRDGRTLHAYDAAADGGATRLAVLWHHGTPNRGAPPEPLFPAAARHGIRWVSYDRPGYGGSTPNPGRDVASAAADVASIADAFGIERFAAMGHSGGGMYALACGGLLAERVLGVVCTSGLAPFDAQGLDWFAGMAAAGAAELRAATRGRAALEDHFASTDYDPEQVTPADHAALSGPWAWLVAVAEQALEGDPRGMPDDDLAYVTPWGFVQRVPLNHAGPSTVATGEALAANLVPSRATVPTRTMPAAAHSRKDWTRNPARACSWRARKRAMVTWLGSWLAASTRKVMSSFKRRSIWREERTPMQ
jgi:pimeloyl-ACP methyl ester carboxylesterase